MPLDLQARQVDTEATSELSTLSVRSSIEKVGFLPELPENCPFPVEYIDTRLSKPGLRIIGPMPLKDYFPELTKGEDHFINQELLGKFGFILLENCIGDSMGEVLKKKSTQMPHQDTRENRNYSRKPVDVISLNSHPKEELLRKESYTVIGEDDEVMRFFTQYFQEHKNQVLSWIKNNNIPSSTRSALILILSLIQDVEKKDGIGDIDFDKFLSTDYTDRLWKNIIFRGQYYGNFSFTNEAFDHYPKTEEFYNFMRNCMYFHDWKLNQRVLIDNMKMAHARVCKGAKDITSNSVIVSKDLSWDMNNELVRSKIQPY